MKTMEKIETDEHWTTIIKPQGKFFNVNIKELINYKDLILLFVKRDFVAYYKQTILGPLWYIIQPVFTTLIFTVIFGQIAKIPTDGVPQLIFYMSGTILWNYFSQCLIKTSTTFISNAGIFGKVYFPRLTTPISIVISNLITFLIQFVLFIGFLIFFYLKGSNLTTHVLLLVFTPLLILFIAMQGLGMGILIAALTTKYRDLQQLVGFGVQLWMYATPIVYPLSQIPVKWKWIFILNPMTAVVESFRYLYLGSGELNYLNLGISFAISILILFFGIVLFSRIEKTFMDKV
jgi:lipopolysaccharide transport system permease protein